MIELGQLESHHAEFETRKIQVVVVSVEEQADAEKTKADFPHLTIVSDAKHEIVEAVAVLHAKAAPNGSDTAVPTTLLIDGTGTVRWTFRPSDVLTRLSPAQLLKEIDARMPAE